MALDAAVKGVGAQLGNWNTTVERILAEIHRNRQVDRDAVQRALISAIRHYRWHRFHFNMGRATMLTTVDQLEYGFESFKGAADGVPKDLLEFDWVFIDRTPTSELDNGAANNLVDMARLHHDEMRVTLQGSNASGSFPYWFSYYDQTMFLFPIPKDEFVVSFEYLSDLDTPAYQFVGGEWVFYDSVGTEITDAYANPWLDHAEELIRSRAKAEVLGTVLEDPDGMQIARGVERDALRDLKKANYHQNATKGVIPTGPFGEFYAYGRRYF